MPPITRSQARQTTPDRSIERCEYTTTKKMRFFQAYDERHGQESMRSIAASQQVTKTTASRWLHERDQFGSPVYRKTRRLSNKLYHPEKVTKETYKMLVSPSRNPVRNQTYEAQIAFHELPIKRRALVSGLTRHTNKGRRYKQAYVQKVLSRQNLKNRYEYGLQYCDKTIEDFWQYIFFTDEAHIDPSSMGQGMILRERGTRTDSENIQQRPPRTGVKLHIAGWINWNAKCKKLLFYNDENDYTMKPKRPPKPRKTMYESEEEYAHRLREWEASIGHDQVVKPKGNSMTEKYYCKNLLPVYIKAIQEARIHGNNELANWILQEDNDSSHGHKRNGKKGLADELKDANWIPTFNHPSLSPDLNPKEGCWNIIKPRIRTRTWHSINDLKAIIQEEWDKVTILEIKARISEMPKRCKELVRTGGKPIKSSLW